MRTDENGDSCPETLGEYLDLCIAIGGLECRAVEILESKISKATKGRDELVIASDSQMREILMPNLIKPRENSREAT